LFLDRGITWRIRKIVFTAQHRHELPQKAAKTIAWCHFGKICWRPLTPLIRNPPSGALHDNMERNAIQLAAGEFQHVDQASDGSGKTPLGGQRAAVTGDDLGQMRDPEFKPLAF
jgi:hypothetical protein